MNKRGHKRGTIFEFNLDKINIYCKSKNLCLSNVLNINGLKWMKFNGEFTIPPSEVL